MRFVVLGTVRAWRGDVELELGPPQQRALLALLLVHAGHPVALHEIVDVLWGDDRPGTAANLVHRYVGALRRLFEPDLPARGHSSYLTRGSGGYKLDVDPESIDLLRFRALRFEAGRRAEAGDHSAAAEALLEALSLWRGPTADGIAPEIRVYPAFTSVDDEVLSVLRAAAEQAAEAGPAVADRVLDAVRLAAARHPLDEGLQARLMLLLATTGKQAEALVVYQQTRDTLAADLGLDPGPELQTAHLRVLQRAEAPPAAVPAVRPAQLPADLAVFAGRRHELDQLGSLPPGVPVVAIGGMAGVGKTTLAVHWAHRIAGRFPDGQLYADLHGFHPGGAITSAADVLRSFLDALGVPASRVPAGLEAQSALFRSVLAGRRVLIVLDNARDSEHILPLLPGTPGSLAVVTSRHRLYDLVAMHGATAITLDLLPYADATELMTRRLGSDRIVLDRGAAEQIVELTGRLPLTLAMVSAQAAMNPGFALSTIADELRRSHGSLDAFAGESSRSDARSVFAWSYRILSPAAARLFRLLALHPGADLSLAAAQALTGEPNPRKQFTELLRAHLVTETVPGRFGVHDLLRAYAAELVDPAEAGPARRRVVDHYLHSAWSATGVLYPTSERLLLDPPVDDAVPIHFHDGPRAATWLDAERAVLVDAVEQAARAGLDQQSWQLAITLETYLDRAGSWLVQREMQTTAHRAAEALGDRRAQAYTRRALGFAEGRLGRFAEADRHLSVALSLFAEAGDDKGEARTHRLVAFLANRRGQHLIALEHYRVAGDLYRRVGWLSGAASVHNESGWTYIMLGDLDRAIQECRLAISVHRQNGDPSGEAAAWDSLGLAQHRQEAYEEALESFGHALNLYRMVCDKYLVADTLAHIGDACHAAGRADSAVEAWREALELLEDLGHPDAGQVREKAGLTGRSESGQFSG
ncbi:AfsR/SARP family transcriptional regulator [Actinoplanes solisilvae]|uniref:AfsR/SARP family transcriptional regulator n=1 Tax=Actinoplanes solisilvae TaxID=2486853 RepID=UPI000FDC1B1D|nr:BTAD domain-containing putative transcriptional regulator [Actinoplanes solisilvae]